jgi:hypothetical protein
MQGPEKDLYSPVILTVKTIFPVEMIIWQYHVVGLGVSEGGNAVRI